MKRLITALCVGLLFISGCTSKPSQDDNNINENTNKNDTAKERDVKKIMKGILDDQTNNLPSMMDVDDTVLKDMYGIDAADVQQYAIAFPMMDVHASEIIIIEAKDGKADTIQKALDARMKSVEDTWANYLPDQYELVQNRETITKGNTFVIIIAEKAQEIKSKIAESL